VDSGCWLTVDEEIFNWVWKVNGVVAHCHKSFIVNTCTVLRAAFWRNKRSKSYHYSERYYIWMWLLIEEFDEIGSEDLNVIRYTTISVLNHIFPYVFLHILSSSKILMIEVWCVFHWTRSMKFHYLHRCSSWAYTCRGLLMLLYVLVWEFNLCCMKNKHWNWMCFEHWPVLLL